MTYVGWRRLHLGASWTVVVLAVIHSVLTPFIYGEWSPDALWFLGTGLGLLVVGAANLAHIGIEPCRQPTARMVRITNYVFAAFGLAAVLAVPEPHAMLIFGCLVLQAVASHWTLPEASREYGIHDGP